ncbi:MAG: VCBS repeat-containing protein, partial [Verrucomicrobiales bacterium]|nr:VCBS repeat-containing protein [Verrucomicrobiales bacterium]
VANADRKSFLYRNHANGTFSRITAGEVANDMAWTFSGTWGDYDNDGFLDLFVANWNNNRQEFEIETSADLVNWMPLTTATNQHGSLTVEDSNVSARSAGFYRVRQK